LGELCISVEFGSVPLLVIGITSPQARDQHVPQEDDPVRMHGAEAVHKEHQNIGRHLVLGQGALVDQVVVTRFRNER